MTTSDAANEPGIAGYVLKQKLGQGGMGVVYLVEGRDGELVALKMIRPAGEANRGEIGRFA